MADVLSQSQIDDLLKSFGSGGDKAIEEIAEQTAEKKYKVYDFRMPKKFTKERLRLLDRIFENFSRLLSSYFTGLLRLYCRISILQIEEQRYYEFNNALPEHTIISVTNLGLEDEDIDDPIMVTQISNPITFTMLDRLLGGNGNFVDVVRDFTEIETSLMSGILKKMCEYTKEAWSSFVDINPSLQSIETNSRILQTIAPDDVVIIIVMEVEINSVKNTISICLPAIDLEQMMIKYGEKTVRSNKRNDVVREKERKEEIMHEIKNSPLTLSATLCETSIDLRDILNLQVNDIIPLNANINNNVKVKVGETIWFDGKLGLLHNRKAIKLDNIIKKN